MEKQLLDIVKLLIDTNNTIESANQTMKIALITNIVSIFLAFVTIGSNWYINVKSKELEYKNDYYKKNHR